jgi:2-oxoisovalerate dehydrogenase E2 component (dihydrolipoyl transacylase)
MSTELKMPQLGESVVEGTISRWLKQVGDEVKEYEPLLEVSTDKVDTEIPSTADGVILEILVTEGETVGVGTPLCLIGEPGEAVDDRAKEARTGAEGNGQAGAADSEQAETPQRSTKGPHITPVVARIAAEHNIDVTTLSGTGAGGRVTKKDILAYIEQQQEAKEAEPAPTPAPVARPWDQPGSGDLFAPTDKIFARSTEEAPQPATTPAPTPAPPTTSVAPFDAHPGDIIPLTGMRKAIADHMALSKRTSPHVTTVMEADCSNLVNFCQQHGPEFERREGISLTYTPIFISAIIAGLKAVPLVNSVLTNKGIELKPEINIGVAVALDDGLIVPVIKNADNLSLTGLQRAVTGLAYRARHKQLSPDDVQGGTFTLSNHGVSGSLFATPIINQPQVGILGVGKVEKRVVVVSQNGADSIAIKPMCYLSLTFDHRILDGANADKFLATVKATVENWG